MKNASRWLLTGGAGDAFVSMSNSYTMTTYGQTKALGMSSHTETASGQAVNYFSSVAL